MLQDKPQDADVWIRIGDDGRMEFVYYRDGHIEIKES
jgi:hypothetical protein